MKTEIIYTGSGTFRFDIKDEVIEGLSHDEILDLLKEVSEMVWLYYEHKEMR